MHTRWAERGLRERSNLLSRLRLWRLPYKTSYPRRGFCKEMLLSGKMNQNKETQRGATERCRTLRYDGCHVDQHLFVHLFDFILGIVGHTRGVAVCLHFAQVTRRKGTWVAIVLFEYGKCLWTVARKIRQKTSPGTSGTKKMHTGNEWLHERQARIRKTVAVKFLIWPAFSCFLLLFILYGLPSKGSSTIVLRMLMSTKWRGRTGRYINQASSSEKKIRLVPYCCTGMQKTD